MKFRRRHFLLAASGVASHLVLPPAAASSVITKPIPGNRQRIAAIGLGSWITFDIDPAHAASRLPIIREFFERGGQLIDSSPMYGRSPDVIGRCLAALDKPTDLVAASKVWVPGAERGVSQMAQSLARWGLPRFDLMQIHNMVDWRSHLATLREMKQDGRIRYIGITTSHGRRHENLIQALDTGAFDFVQFSYNIVDREAERRLLPAAAENGVAVIINRPFQTGGLFRRVGGNGLPSWANEIDCKNWAQVFLKYVVSHPQVTVAIPATSKLAHLRENLGALRGPLPDPALRQRMAADFLRVA